MENWFAMRVTYRREMKVKAEMDALGVPAFVPMRRIIQKGRRLKNSLEPAIHNLIFIHSTEEKVQALKKSRPELQYMMRQMDGKMEKIIVPEHQMEDFMKVCTESPDFVEIVPTNEITLKPGEEVMIEEGGDYGWVIDKDVTIADVTDAVLTGAQGERTPTFLYSGMGWDNGDLTGTYVEVSIAEQHLWCYKDYELVIDTDVVTGLPTTERETTRGCFAIDAKKEDAVLGSLDVQGYESPVSYWAPFNGGQGLHDAPWRDDFGGDIYESNGSHGCVNIPPWNMEAIYNAIEIGNAVVIY